MLADADPIAKAALYAALGLTLTCEHEQRLVRVEALPTALGTNERVGGRTRGLTRLPRSYEWSRSRDGEKWKDRNLGLERRRGPMLLVHRAAGSQLHVRETICRFTPSGAWSPLWAVSQRHDGDTPSAGSPPRYGAIVLLGSACLR